MEGREGQVYLASLRPAIMALSAGISMREEEKREREEGEGRGRGKREREEGQRRKKKGMLNYMGSLEKRCRGGEIKEVLMYLHSPSSMW